jgi:hypothetical protein
MEVKERENRINKIIEGIKTEQNGRRGHKKMKTEVKGMKKK